MKIQKVVILFITLIMICGVASAVVISDFGNGVMFFNGYPEQFGSDLSKYLTDHPQLRVVSIASFDNSGFGQTSGYYVVFENKTSNHMTCNPVWDGKSVGTTAIVNYNCMSIY